MSTASATSAATSSSKFAQWRKARKLENQSRNVASRQIKGSRLVLRYITLIVVAILMVGPLLLPLLAAFKAPGESVFGQGATIFPQTWSLAAFTTLFKQTAILRAIGNSVIVAALTVVSNIILSCLGG